MLISAPQRGLERSPCCAMVMLSERALGHRRHDEQQLLPAT